MIKKLLKKFFRSFTFDSYSEKIEKYLSQSSNTYDLEQRIREFDQNNNYILLDIWKRVKINILIWVKNYHFVDNKYKTSKNSDKMKIFKIF